MHQGDVPEFHLPDLVQELLAPTGLRRVLRPQEPLLVRQLYPRVLQRPRRRREVLLQSLLLRLGRVPFRVDRRLLLRQPRALVVKRHHEPALLHLRGFLQRRVQRGHVGCSERMLRRR